MLRSALYRSWLSLTCLWIHAVSGNSNWWCRNSNTAWCCGRVIWDELPYTSTVAVEDMHLLLGSHFTYTSTNVLILEPHTAQILRFDCIIALNAAADSSASHVITYTAAQRALLESLTVRNVQLKCVSSVYYFATISETHPGVGVCKYYGMANTSAARRAGPKVQPVSEDAFQTSHPDPIARDHRLAADEVDRQWFDTDEAYQQRVREPDTGSQFIEMLDFVIGP